MPAKTPDSLRPYDDGRLKLTLDSKPYTLRRATIGEQWEFDEQYALVIQAENEDVAWALETLGDLEEDPGVPLSAAQVLGKVRSQDPVETAKRKKVRQEILLGWWMSVFTKLGPADLPELAMEDLPPFLLDFKNVGLAQEAWARNPQAPGDE